ncbi:MAG: response regulator [Pyrinomonadaceae bacterium]|nr:response regulator [Pyrinomonadaceae bacterium]MBP6211735.1 response regulator [Pyrinomonadaceae bacterium]
MSTGTTEVFTQEKSALNAFVERASGRLAGIRNGILIFDQDPSSDGDIDLAIRSLQLLRRDASENDQLAILDLADQCDAVLRPLLGNDPTPAAIGRSLDIVARIEEQLLQVPLHSDDFLPDISAFVDSSFRSLRSDNNPASPTDHVEDFEIDEETLEIFRSEASGLLKSISTSIGVLRSSLDDREALWEIRRASHTFKGAAGIVGLRTASELAHKIEDLLDKIVDKNSILDPQILELISSASSQLDRSIFGVDENEADHLISLYADFDRVIANVGSVSVEPDKKTGSGGALSADKSPTPDLARTAQKPIVRVSLERLDDLIKLSSDLAHSRSSLIEELAKLAECSGQDNFERVFESLAEKFDIQRHLNDELQERLLHIRMVRFGTLETRLSRAVHVTCQEEDKKATVVVENGDCEVDTQIIDALIEPLLHLLKNAVVHGIEHEDTRRLIGKPERGVIRIVVNSEDDWVTLQIEDDGRGISTSKLKDKAMETGLISAEEAAVMSEEDAFDLIFSRGLTTAETLNLNAGRGIGMSIVKESIENSGGSITVVSEPQFGTQFTIKMPVVLPKTTVAERNQLSTESFPDPTNTKNKLVLVVDDSASIRRHTCKQIEKLGYQAITAQNGAEALELLLSGVWRPDIILSDVEMPIMDGWQLLEYVKTDLTFGSIPVVMITTLDAVEHKQRAQQLGASDYFVKPIDEHRLNNTLRTHLSVDKS